jgi:hypothetical protein
MTFVQILTLKNMSPEDQIRAYYAARANYTDSLAVTPAAGRKDIMIVEKCRRLWNTQNGRYEENAPVSTTPPQQGGPGQTGVVPATQPPAAGSGTMTTAGTGV